MNKSFSEELKDAGRGVVAVLRGKRNAKDYFNLSLHGLAGSMIVFLIAATFNAFLPHMLGDDTEAPGQANEAIAAFATAPMALLLVTMIFVFQTGFGAMALHQFKRFDGLVPYLVVSNWASFYFTAIFAVLRIMDLSAFPFLLLMAAVLIITEINILRLVVVLKWVQIAMFIVAQFVGALTALMLLVGFFPNTVLV